MKMFLNKVLGISVAVLFVILFSFYLFELSNLFLLSICLGLGLSLLYVISGFILSYFAINFTQQSFGRIMVISIFGRLALITIAIVTLIKFVTIDKTIFLIALFGFYLIFQIIEVVNLNKISLKGA